MPPPDSDDWRLEMVQGAEGYSWTLKSYRQPRPDWDHDHCLACGQKIAETEMDGQAQTSGYAVGDEHPRGADYDWLCVDCAEQLATGMKWKLLAGAPRA
jgi:hypothetical protein